MLKAMLRVGNNKLGPAMRTAQIGITEKDWDGRKLVGPGEYARAMAFSMLPVPLPISPPVKSLGGAYQRPGQFQRQGMASVGLKTEVAETPSQYVTLQAKKWMADSQDPAIVKKYNDWLKADRGQSDYKDFKAALQFQEEDEAKKYFAELIKSGKTLKQIAQVIRPFSVDNEGTPIGEKPFMTGDRRLEQQFIKQMDDRTRAKYDEARKRRLETYKFFLKTFAKQ